MRGVVFGELVSMQQKLLRAAKRVLKKAYSPYSGFAVGAAVLTTEGEIVTGTNFETAAFDSVCAERAALSAANSRGCGNRCIAIAIVTKSSAGPTSDISASCGSCRQMIYEAAQRSRVGDEFEIIMATTNFEKIVVATIGELFPLAFGPKDLETETKKNPSWILNAPPPFSLTRAISS